MSNMDRFRRKATPAGSAGNITRATEQPKGQPKRVLKDEKNREQIVPETPLVGELASVGLSISIGQATDFSREKVEVTAWCTLPCGITPDERQDAYDECAKQIMSELQPRMDAAIEQFFPHIGKGN